MTSPTPTPGQPKPGEHLAVPAPSVTPDVVAERVSELLTQVDEIRDAETGSESDDVDLSALERQAVLLEQAHQVLSGALEDVDRG